ASRRSPVMAQAVLSHAATQLVTIDELAAIPAGPQLGPRHRPVAHIELVTAVKEAFDERGFSVAREQYSVTREGARLFGTIDLDSAGARQLGHGAEGGLAVGLRHSNDAAFALGVVAGRRVFVCDNLVFSGDTKVLQRKHTSGLDLGAEVRRG